MLVSTAVGTFAYNIKVNSVELRKLLLVLWSMVVSVWGGCWTGILVVAPLESIVKSCSVYQNWFALVHNPSDVSLRVAVELNHGSVEVLHSLLSVKAVLKIGDVAV